MRLSHRIFAFLKLPALCLAAGAALTAQIPTIQSTTVDTAATDNTSFRVLVTAPAASWIQLRYGTTSGVYPYSTKSLAGPAVSLSVGGLVPGATYYVQATARPNPNDNVNICATAACGANEITITTLPNDVVETPVPPATWDVQHPDTAGYTVIPIGIAYPAAAECGATQAVTSPDGWHVSVGDKIPAILAEIGYGAVLEFEQSIACVVPRQNPNNYVGYSLYEKQMDPRAGGDVNSPNHRYIVFRTKSQSSSDFPPFRSRIAPSWSAKLAKFYIQTPSPIQNAIGQVFDANAGDTNGAAPGAHHFWFENLEFAPLPTYTNPPDSVDPVAFQYFFRLGSQYKTTTANSYMVLDRLYMHGWPPPIRQYSAIELGGNHQAMIGCYLSQIHTWRLTAWPLYAGSLDTTGKVLSIPRNQYRLHVSNPMLGMSGPATVTVQADVGYTGTVYGLIYRDHLEIHYTTPTAGSASITCAGCTAVSTPAPATDTTAFTLFSGQIALGRFTNLNWITNCEACTSNYSLALGVQFTDPHGPGGPYLLDNNFMDGVGESFYVDALYSNYGNDDLTYTHNHNIWPKNFFFGDPNWIGWRFDVRQLWEIKRGHRYNVTGNIFSYSWSYQNNGASIFLSGRPQYTPLALDSGITDINVHSNIIRHGRSGMGCMGISPTDNQSNHLDAQVATRISLTNNLMYDLGRAHYCDIENCPGFDSGYFILRPGCQNVTIRNNTGGLIVGDIPSWLYLGGGSVLGGKLDFENNILYLSAGASPYSANILWGGIAGDWPPVEGYSGHDVTPSAAYSVQMSPDLSTIANFKANLDQSYVRIGSTVTRGAYTWKNNIGIGGYKGPAGATVDLTNAQVQAIAQKMPAGDKYPVGNTIAEREAAIRFTDPSHGNYRLKGPSVYSAGGQGVDYDQLYSDTGMVTSIQLPLLAPAAVRLRYIAPDARGCSVDVRASGGAWMRTADMGDGRIRSVTVSGLNADSSYDYRILCYYEQVNDGVLYTEYSEDQTTNGSFKTLPTGTGDVSVQFRLLSVPGAARADVLLTPLTGAPVTQSCTDSPCGFSAPIGDYAMKLTYFDSAGVKLSSGSSTLLSVR